MVILCFLFINSRITTNFIRIVGSYSIINLGIIKINPIIDYLINILDLELQDIVEISLIINLVLNILDLVLTDIIKIINLPFQNMGNHLVRIGLA